VSFEFSLPEWIGKFLSPRFLFAVWALTGLLLFGGRFTDFVGLSTFVGHHHDWLMIVFLFTGVLLLTYVASSFSRGILRVSAQVVHVWRARRHLDRMPPDEKAILRSFLDSEGSAQCIHPSSGAVNVLEARGVLYRASPVGSIVSGYEYAIQPWALEYLGRNPGLLE